MIFETRALLTVTTGRLLCEIGDVYKLLNHMTGENLFTHQLPRAMDECSPWLLLWYPELAKATAELPILDTMMLEHGPEDGLKRWLDSLCERPCYEVKRLPVIRRIHDPIAELVEMTGDERKVIVVNALSDLDKLKDRLEKLDETGTVPGGEFE